MSSNNRRRLSELVRLPENRNCADCGRPEPSCASYTIGVFLCNSCVFYHRSLGSHISRIKSLQLDNWDSTQVAKMEDVGNARAAAIYERYLPVYYRTIRANDPDVLKEQWIRAKYERKDFVNPYDSDLLRKGFMEGMLMQRSKNGSFRNRRFFLSQEDNSFVLKFFRQPTDTKAKCSMRIEHVNATFDAKVHNNGLRISHQPNGSKTCHIFVYSEDGKTIVDWYTAIRAAKFCSRKVAFPAASEVELATALTRDFLLEGYLFKTGPRIGDAYRRRYFILDDRNLMYSDDPLDAEPKGEIPLRDRSDGFSVKAGIPCGLKERGYGFMLLCPERTWLLGAETEEDRDMWIRVLNEVIDSTPSSSHSSNSSWRMIRNGSKQRGSQGTDSMGSRTSDGSTMSLSGPRNVVSSLLPNRES